MVLWAPNFALVPLPSRPTAPVPLMSQSSALAPTQKTRESPMGVPHLRPRLVSPSTWSSPGRFALSEFA